MCGLSMESFLLIWTAWPRRIGSPLGWSVINFMGCFAIFTLDQSTTIIYCDYFYAVVCLKFRIPHYVIVGLEIYIVHKIPCYTVNE